MDFTALLYLFSFCISNFVVLEQPRDSVLPKCTSMRLVLNFTCSGRVLTYGAAFGAGSLNPGNSGAMTLGFWHWNEGDLMFPHRA